VAQRIQAVVIGGGQAGLAISYYLTRQGYEHVVLEQAAHAVPAWRERRWDSFTLVTPNWTVRLPGFAYEGADPDGFMTRAEIVGHFDRYAASFAPPIRCGERVTAVDPVPTNGGYDVSTTNGLVYNAQVVVVATGSFQFPRPTPLPKKMPRDIVQLHSSQYRGPGDLPPGAVLVIGSADTGCQITEELYESGRQVYLCVGRSSRIPRRYRGKDAVFWAMNLGLLGQTTDHLTDPGERFTANPHLTGKNGGHTLNLHHFARNGVVLLGRLVDVQDGAVALAPDLSENLALADKGSNDFRNNVDAFVQRTGMDVPAPEPDPLDEARSNAGESSPAAIDLRTAGITSVVWANGYGFNYNWVRLPVLDDWGHPIQRRGVTRFPGLYFLGMNRLYDRKSGILLGVGDDAAHVAENIARDCG
jgi:putative flavoprotein involved in K+ transport